MTQKLSNFPKVTPNKNYNWDSNQASELHQETFVPSNCFLIYKNSLQYDPLGAQKISKIFFWLNSCRYWDLKSGACVRIFNGHQGTVTCMDLYKNRLCLLYTSDAADETSTV